MKGRHERVTPCSPHEIPRKIYLETPYLPPTAAAADEPLAEDGGQHDGPQELAAGVARRRAAHEPRAAGVALAGDHLTARHRDGAALALGPFLLSSD